MRKLGTYEKSKTLNPEKSKKHVAKKLESFGLKWVDVAWYELKLGKDGKRGSGSFPNPPEQKIVHTNKKWPQNLKTGCGASWDSVKYGQ